MKAPQQETSIRVSIVKKRRARMFDKAVLTRENDAIKLASANVYVPNECETKCSSSVAVNQTVLEMANTIMDACLCHA